MLACFIYSSITINTSDLAGSFSIKQKPLKIERNVASLTCVASLTSQLALPLMTDSATTVQLSARSLRKGLGGIFCKRQGPNKHLVKIGY